ncbi:sensor histidine kinase [Kaistia adipata]|uniref:sensor histidine kinase n=1 Tax=Kaistia adipata TaxID=166954 RepID=UPI000683F5C8|nr:sensor histidine kinase [Kaistia adipata]
MGKAVRALDWDRTPLGPPTLWPQSLRTVVALVLASPFPKCLVWGPEMIAIYNDAFVPILGKKQIGIGSSFRDMWSEAWRTIGPIVDKAFSGEATFIEDFPLVVNRYGYPEQTYFTFAYTPLLDEFGEVAGFMDTVIETTSKVEAETRLRVLNAELGHRMKNTQAIVQAIARQTLRGQADDAALAAFTQRLMALSSAHEILLRQSWEAAPLHNVVEAALKHNAAPDRFQVEGPDLTIGPKAVISVSLMLHEMVTNAVKHGALSVETGRVEIRWTIEGDAENATLHMRWIERGGPPAQRPTRHGFGSRLINGGLTGAGRARLQFLPTGLEGHFEAPVNWISAGERGGGL